jgi:dethiobiotin synthetase
MTNGFIITGTDTGIGKTVASAMLTLALDGIYWKPVQSGMDGETDIQTVKRLTGLPDDRFLPEAYVFSQPLSPHRAAELDRITVSPPFFILPPPRHAGGNQKSGGRRIIIEGAGGLLVPFTREILMIDLFKQWNLPVILCARTALGTINHTLLSVEALKARGMTLHGILFIGDDNKDNIRTIGNFSSAKILGRMPIMEDINPRILQQIFAANFKREDFENV